MGRMTVVLLAVATLAGCGGGSSGSGGAALTCQILGSDQYCFRVYAKQMYECMGLQTVPQPGSLPDYKFYVRGHFTADGTACTDDKNPDQHVTFEPPADVAHLSGWLYSGSFTMYAGSTACGTVDLPPPGDPTYVVTTDAGRASVTKGDTVVLECPDGKYSAPKSALAGCWSQLPTTSGAVNSGTNAKLTLHPGAEGVGWDCTAP